MRTQVRLLVTVSLCVLLVPGCLDPARNAWALQATGLDALQRQGLDGDGVRVAILDTGIDLRHPSLRHLADGDPFNGELTAYEDFIGEASTPRDADGHGTFLAGVLAGRPPGGLRSITTTPGDAVQGLAPGVDLVVGRVCRLETCNLYAVWLGLQWAIAQRADVISLSLGFTQGELGMRPDLALKFRAALDEAEKQGILIVAAAGNQAPRGVLFPANQDTVLGVGASDRAGAVRPSSARGDGKPDLVAPGEGIEGPALEGGRIAVSGTSAAVPFVVAVAALLIDAAGNPDDARDVARLRQAIVSTAAPLPGQRMPQDPRAGHGLVQGQAALDEYRLLPPP